jgi:chemotaxis protein MotA
LGAHSDGGCLPIADNLQVKRTDEDANRTLILDGILMIRESKSAALVRGLLANHRHEVTREAE